MSFLLNVLIVVVCLALAGVFGCIAVLVWEPGKRQGWRAQVGFTVAVVLGTLFATASVVVPLLDL